MEAVIREEERAKRQAHRERGCLLVRASFDWGTELEEWSESYSLPPEFLKVTLKALEVFERKNADYTGGSDDPFANFKFAAEVAGVSVEQGLLVRMADKMSRLSSLLGKGKEPRVKDEAAFDTAHDLAVYALILSAWLLAKVKGRKEGDA